MSEPAELISPPPDLHSKAGDALSRISDTIERDLSIKTAFMAVVVRDGSMSWGLYGEPSESVELGRVAVMLGTRGTKDASRSADRLRALLRIESFGRHLGLVLRIVGIAAFLGLWFPGPVHEAAATTLQVIGIASILLLTLLTYATGLARDRTSEEHRG